MTPNLWPRDVSYTNTVQCKRGGKLNIASSIEDVELKRIDDLDHILYGEYGLFAKRDWEKYEIIGCYTGELVCNKGGKYNAFSHISRSGTQWSIDAETKGNETRFINDYRNIANCANVTFSSAIVYGQRAILLVVKNTVKKGEEFLTDYGESYWDHI